MRDKRSPNGKVLGYVTPVRAYLWTDRVYTHVASGRVAEALAAHYLRAYLCTRTVHGPPESATDLALAAPNIEVVPQPFWDSSLAALRHPLGIARAYLRVVRGSDLLFIRGMCPLIGVLYLLAWLWRRPVCHWIVGNPIALLRSHTRAGRVADSLALLYAWQDRLCSRLGRWLTGGAFICNGQELGTAYRSPRTRVTASSTVTANEFYHREDTCQGSTIRILFVGYLRPEKGVEYLLEACARLRLDRPWELIVVGQPEFPEYRRRLEDLVAARGIAGRVHWQGYVSFGEPIFAQMRAADVLVLPSLSEGTPHVLVESRANSLPTVSTNVGGIPTTVTHEHDALLVPPKDPDALAAAITRIVTDGELRRRLIRSGRESARRLTVECFVELVRHELEPAGAGAAARRVG